MKYAKTIIELAKSWIGRNESDGTHRYIIDIYNNEQDKLPRNYRVKYTDAWCATTISALAIKCGFTDIIPTECSCQKMIELFKGLGSWVENENRTPNAGDIIFYDWDDSGSGDNTGWSDHVGIVEKVSGTSITVIEGNYSNAVKRRTLQVNGKYIRGYGVPKYDVENANSSEISNTLTQKVDDIKLPTIKNGSKGKAVEVWQVIVGTTVDGDFGTKTKTATIEFQKKTFPNDSSEWDGIVGDKTWKSGLKSL